MDLISAAYQNNLAIAELLIEAGAEVNRQDNTQKSAYLTATSKGYLELLRFTLQAGADIHSTDMDTQLRLANVGETEASLHVFIGGIEVDGSPFTLATGASIRRSFPNIDRGPVKVESNVNIVVAEHVIYKVNSVPTSFSEMMGLPNSLLDTLYWLPWYNNRDLDTQLRFGTP